MKTILQIVDFFVENGIIPTWMCISHTEGKGENAGSFQFTHTSYYLNKYNPVHGRINAQPGVNELTHISHMTAVMGNPSHVYTMS